MVSLSFFVTWRGRAAEMRRMIRDCSEWVSQGKLYSKNVWTGSQVNDLRLENLFFLVLGFWVLFFFWMLEVLNVDSQIDLDRLHCFFLDLMRTPLVLKIYH